MSKGGNTSEASAGHQVQLEGGAKQDFWYHEQLPEVIKAFYRNSILVWTSRDAYDLLQSGLSVQQVLQTIQDYEREVVAEERVKTWSPHYPRLPYNPTTGLVNRRPKRRIR